MGVSSPELLDGRDHYTPDFKCLPFLGCDVGKGHVRGLEFDAPSPLVECLADKITIDHRHHDLSVAGRDRPIDQHHIAIKNPNIAHGLTPHAQQEGRLGVLDGVFPNKRG